MRFAMKTATLPSLRVAPELRAAAESVLEEGESLSAFVENSVKAQIHYRKTQAEFIARGLAAREEAKRTGIDYTTEDVLRSEEHTSEPQSLMRNSYAVFCLKKQTIHLHPSCRLYN